ncbi:tyrosine-type recombinase/integrase [Paenibacillus sp. 32352]|uniref:tyrosine-type recombinase/integrase n=1 Tax=Paenibacillus sp. 32352 TaxID=1969111 RepID=UPI0009AEA452|nr:tyrosine-type recombinase/integrase [Paenibacillus sp. 32352]
MARNYDLEDFYAEPIQAFVIWMKQAGYTEATRKEYLREVLSFLESLNELPVQKVGKMQIVGFLVSKQNTAGDKTRNRTLSAIRAFYTALIDLELATRNPAMEIKKSKTEKNRKPVYLEENDLKQTMQYIDGRYKNRNMAVFLLMSYCGLRVGEIHRMNVSDFNPSKGTLEVFGKGRKWNEIPLPPMLIQYLAQVVQERIIPHSSKEDAFFISQKGRRLSIRQIQKIASQTFALLKEEHPHLSDLELSCHKLRHSFATMLLRHNVDIRVVKELMGHASIETTMIYTHVNNEQKKTAMSSLELPELVLA